MEFDLAKLAELAKKATRELPQDSFAVAVVGSTGHGKSTLLNAMFGENLAKTGIGSPQTQHAEWWPKHLDSPLRILDTKGLEEKDYENTVESLMAAIEEANSSNDIRKHLHIVWLVIKESSARVQDSHKDIVRQLTGGEQSKRVPVIAVLTQATNPSDEFKSEIYRQIPDIKNVVRVNSVPEPIMGGGVIPTHGLDVLYNATMDLLPEAKDAAGIRTAFIRTTRIREALEEKKRLSLNAVHIASAAAAAAAVNPIPFSDAFIIAPIQAGMIAKISHYYGIDVSEDTLIPVVSTVAGCIAATMAGRAIFTGILKLIPGVGSLVGGAIGATTAAAITEAFGHVYVEFMHTLCSENDGDPPSITQIVEGFTDFYKRHGTTLGGILNNL